MALFTFTLYGIANVPLSGCAGQITWHVLVDATSGIAVTPLPAFTELGSSGQYRASVPPNAVGIVDAGAGADSTPVPGSDPLSPTPRFTLLPAAQQFVCTVYSPVTGLPVEGLSPTWDSFFDASTGLAITAPGITEIGGGLYRVDQPYPLTSSGVLDFGSSEPLYSSFIELDLTPGSGGGGGTGPTLSNPQPVPGVGTIGGAQALTFTLADPDDSDPSLQINITFPNGIVEAVYGDSIGGFSALYSGSFYDGVGVVVVQRSSAWPASPTMGVYVRDVYGGTASAQWSWTLAVPAVAPQTGSALVVSSTTQGRYGYDWRSFLDLGNGPETDPYYRLVGDPQVVLGNAILRRLSTPQGALFYAPNDGIDIRAYVNAAMAAGDVRQLQQAVQNELQKEKRLSSVAVTAALNASTSELALRIVAQGAAGPFSGVFLFSALDAGVVVSRLSFG